MGGGVRRKEGAGSGGWTVAGQETRGGGSAGGGQRIQGGGARVTNLSACRFVGKLAGGAGGEGATLWHEAWGLSLNA